MCCFQQNTQRHLKARKNVFWVRYPGWWVLAGNLPLPGPLQVASPPRASLGTFVIWAYWAWVVVMLSHCWWECKLVQPLWRTVWKVLKKLNIELPLWPSYLTPGHISGEKCNLKTYSAPQWSLRHYLQWPGHENNLNVHWQRSGWRRCGTYIQWNITQP